MKKDEKNFIVDEIKREKSGVKKGESSFWSELFDVCIEVFLNALPIIMFLIAIVYAVEGLKVVLSELKDAEEREQTSVIETSDNSERGKNSNSSDDFFWSYYYSYYYYYIISNA